MYSSIFCIAPKVWTFKLQPLFRLWYTLWTVCLSKDSTQPRLAVQAYSTGGQHLVIVVVSKYCDRYLLL